MSGTPSKQPRGGAGGVEKQVNVQVAVRCRPPNDKERGEPHFNIVQCDEDAAQISTPGTQGVVRKGASATGQKTYGFDVVFGQTSTQKQVYDALCAPIVDEVRPTPILCVHIPPKKKQQHQHTGIVNKFETNSNQTRRTE